jgi:tetratricopeptide (TPR) repeat protein
MRKDPGTLAVFATTLLVYLLTLAPTVTGEDSGELIAAAYTLGIPHPSGYPLWCLVSQPFLWLPIGDIAYRVNLGSAVTSALACALVVPLLRSLGVSAIHTVGPALLLGFSATLWAQSVIAEVYPLTLLTLVLLGLSLSRWQANAHRSGWMHVTAFLSGLCLSAHHTVVLLYPLILITAIKIGGRRLLRPTVWLAFLAGLSVYVYLPIRAAAQPAMNWGNPDTPARFWAHVTRGQYPSLLSSQHSLGQSLGQLKATATYLLQQWPWPVSLLVCLGALLGVRHNKLLAVALLVLSAGFALLLNFHLDYEEVHIAEVFFIPAWLMLVLLLALGSQGLGKAGAAVTLAMAVVACLGNLSSTTMAGNTVARRYAEDVLKTLPPDAILFTGADYEAFPVTYLQIVEHQRPDVVALNDQSDLARAEQLLRQRARPVYATRPLGEFSAGQWLPVGLLYANLLDPASAPELDASAWKSYGAPRKEGSWNKDWSTASLLGLYDLAQARSILSYQGKPDQALPPLQRAADRQSEDALLMNSIGALLVRHRRPEEALIFYKKAVELQPDYAKAQHNLVLALCSLGRFEEAREQFKKSPRDQNLEKALLQARVLEPDLEEAEERTRTHPQQSEAWLQLGLLKARLNVVSAVEDLEKATQLAPANVEAWAQLGLLRARAGDRIGAQQAWQAGLRADPKGPMAETLRTELEKLQTE